MPPPLSLRLFPNFIIKLTKHRVATLSYDVSDRTRLKTRVIASCRTKPFCPLPFFNFPSRQSSCVVCAPDRQVVDDSLRQVRRTGRVVSVFPRSDPCTRTSRTGQTVSGTSRRPRPADASSRNVIVSYAHRSPVWSCGRGGQHDVEGYRQDVHTESQTGRHGNLHRPVDIR